LAEALVGRDPKIKQPQGFASHSQKRSQAAWRLPDPNPTCLIRGLDPRTQGLDAPSHWLAGPSPATTTLEAD